MTPPPQPAGDDAATTEFRLHVVRGLKQSPKHIPSRFLYDAEGDRLFQKIMACGDYYPTRAEDEIMRMQADEVIQALAGDHRQFSLFELGAGDGAKTKHLLRRAMATGRDPMYRPIDISEHVLEVLRHGLAKELPGLRFQAEQGEYFQVVQRGLDGDGPKAVLFLGSNIGNMLRQQAVLLLKSIASHMGPDDRLLVGFDRKKDPAVILRAYNDRDGFTREFNLNLLRRINRELGADFNVDAFIHAPSYDPVEGRALSFLVSTCDQTVHVPGMMQPVHFKAWEALHTEISQKYDQSMIEELAAGASLRITEQFSDSLNHFLDVVFAVR